MWDQVSGDSRETYLIKEGLIKPVMGTEKEKEKEVSANCEEEMVGCMV